MNEAIEVETEDDDADDCPCRARNSACKFCRLRNISRLESSVSGGKQEETAECEDAGRGARRLCIS